MKLHLLLLIAFLALIVKAQDEIDQNDFPPVCSSACQSLVSTMQRCDDTTDGDAAYLNCVCNSADASSLLPSCGACIRSNGGDADNDAIELALSCGFAVPGASNSTSSTSASFTSTTAASSSSTTMTRSSMSTASTTPSATSTSQGAAPTSGGNANAGSRLEASVMAAPLLLLPFLAVL
ncbi:uncharacterized protein SRS1_21002 [Sporisorium reilianum f. sp. reilianum]|uniref:Extracellular membrane protein CFEM domain-containing protein n=1 Tax=Sporisorium reilianum f. sp. reilianum TaxID=72559 RepID=A0A2N8UL88_9BASI|nr:uncharacterized protein SRS1_21002 [Sporisorium reilianum f. sp. reilianum]